MSFSASSAPTWLDRLAAHPRRALLLFSLALLLCGNWLLPVTDRDEARFSEASREMLQRGDYVVVWFNGHWRFDKPVLIYWCQAASYRVFGTNAFAARLPSALFTTGIALLLASWARRTTGNKKTALLAGAMFVTGLHIAIIGRVATADMALVFFYTLSAWSGWELTRPEQARRKFWWWTFYGSLALGFLAKGPEAWLPLVVLFWGKYFRKESFRLPPVETLAGIFVTLILVCLWGVPAVLQTGGEYARIGLGEHVLNRSVNVNDTHGLAGTLGFIVTLPVYFVTFFASFFPWSTRVPSALRRWWPERGRDDFGWYLLAQAAVVFAVFSLVRTKLPHYTAPAWPLLALWFARQITDDRDLGAWFGRRLALMTALVLALTLGFFPFMRGRIATENLWNEVKPHVRPETKVGCFGFTEASLVWNFRSVATNNLALGDDIESAKRFLTNAPPLVIVVPSQFANLLPDTNGLRFEARGLDAARFKPVSLTAVVKE
jgi:4-amino-4-deoxy-L-arabinose transferase-like glycosyltransferase